MTTTTAPAVIQALTAPRAAGGIPLGPMPRVTGKVVESSSGEQGVSIVMPRRIFEKSNVAIGHCLRLFHPRRGVVEWIVSKVVDGDGSDRSKVTVEAGPVRRLLALRGDVRVINSVGAPTTSFTPPASTVEALLNTYVLTNLAVDSLDWLEIGNIEYSGTIDIGIISNQTRGQVLDSIERATGYKVVLRRLDDDSAYVIDVVRQLNADAPVRQLSIGRNLKRIVRTTDLALTATVVVPRTSNGALMDETSWRVAAVSGAWVKLEDPAGGPAVIREDDQLVGMYLVPLDGLPRIIDDSRKSDSSVHLADTSGITVGTSVTVWTNTTGGIVTEVASPSGVASSRGIIRAPVSLATPYNTRNLIAQPFFSQGLDGWRVQSSNGRVDPYSRTEPSSDAGEADGAVSSGVTALPVRGFSTNFRFHKGQPLYVRGAFLTADTDAVVDGSGHATIPITSALTADIPANTEFVQRRGASLVGTVQANGIQATSATSLALKGLRASTFLVNGDKLQFTVGGLHRLNVTAVSGAGSSRTLTIDPISVDLPTTTVLEIVERWNVPADVGPATTLYSSYWQATVDTTVAAGGTSVNVTVTSPAGRPDMEVYYSRYDGSAQYDNTHEETYTVNAAANWDAAGSATPGLSTNLASNVAAGTEVRWARGTTPLGSLTTNGGTAGVASLQLNAGSFVSIVPAGDTFALPAFVVYTDDVIQLDANGDGVVTLASATPAAIIDGTIIETRICPDFAESEPKGPSVLRLIGNNSTEPTYHQTGRYLIMSPVARVYVAEGTTKTIRFALGVTRWAAEQIFSGFLSVDECFIQLWDTDTKEKLASFAMSSIMTDPIPFAADGSATEDLTLPIEYTLDRTRRVEITIAPLSGYSGARWTFLFARWCAWWCGAAGIPPVVGSYSNSMHHRAQDTLETRRTGARYAVQMSRSIQSESDDGLLLLDAPARVRSETLGVNEELPIERIMWSTSNPHDMQVELAIKSPRLSIDAFTGN